MEWVLSTYWICLLIGIVYTVIALIMGGIGAHGDISQAHMDGHIGHVGSADADPNAGQVIFGPFSPLVIAFFLTSIGASGIVLTSVFGQSPYVSLPTAVACGFLLAWLLISFFNRVLGGLQSSSEVRLYTLIGCEGEVTVEIPANGIGEIAYVAMGSRYVSPARGEEPVMIPRFSGVRITRMVGNIFYVSPLTEDQLRDIGTLSTPKEQ